DVVVEQLQQDVAHLGVAVERAAGFLVGHSDRFRPERVVLRHQVGVAQQHADALVERRELLRAELAQLGSALLVLQVFRQVVVADELERHVNLRKALAFILQLARVRLEFLEVGLVELRLERPPLRREHLARLLVRLLRFAVLYPRRHFDQRLVGLLEHAGDRAAQALAEKIAAFLEQVFERACLLAALSQAGLRSAEVRKIIVDGPRSIPPARIAVKELLNESYMKRLASGRTPQLSGNTLRSIESSARASCATSAALSSARRSSVGRRSRPSCSARSANPGQSAITLPPRTTPPATNAAPAVPWSVPREPLMATVRPNSVTISTAVCFQAAPTESFSVVRVRSRSRRLRVSGLYSPTWFA